MTRHPLATPLELRRREEEEVSAGLGEALDREGDRRRDRDARATQAAEAAGRWRRAARAGVEGGSAAAAFLARDRFARRLRGEARRLAEAVRDEETLLREVRAEVEARRRVLAEARAATRALERHREEWLAGRERERRRREQEEIEEVVSGRPGGP